MTMPSSSGERNQTNERIDEEGKRWRHRHWHNHNAHRIGVASAYDNFVGIWRWTRNQRLFGDNAVPGCVILLLIILCYTGARVRRHRAHTGESTRGWWIGGKVNFRLFNFGHVNSGAKCHVAATDWAEIDKSLWTISSSTCASLLMLIMSTSRRRFDWSSHLPLNARSRTTT